MQERAYPSRFDKDLSKEHPHNHDFQDPARQQQLVAGTSYVLLYCLYTALRAALLPLYTSYVLLYCLYTALLPLYRMCRICPLTGTQTAISLLPL